VIAAERVGADRDTR